MNQVERDERKENDTGEGRNRRRINVTAADVRVGDVFYCSGGCFQTNQSGFNILHMLLLVLPCSHIARVSELYSLLCGCTFPENAALHSSITVSFTADFERTSLSELTGKS